MFRGNRSRAGRVIASAIAVALMLSASVLTATATGAAVESQKVDTSAVLQYAVPLDQGGVSFDPASFAAGPQASSWMNLIYDTMIHYSADGKGAPGLATKWSAPDARTVEITLRPGLKFADGTAFNAAAVKAAWDRLLAAKTPQTPPEITAATSIEAVDDATVRVTLSAPYAQFWIDNLLRYSRFLAVPSPAAAAAGTLESKPVGAGPYELDSYLPDQKITLSKNPSYYDKKSQHLASVQITNAAYGQPQLTALQSGTANFTWNVTADQIPTIEGQSGLKVTSKPGVRVYDISLCTTQGPFASKEARQAIQYALDREAVNQGFVAGAGTPTILPLTPVSPFYNKSLEKTYKYDVKKAKALLKQAGVAPGTTVKLLTSTVQVVNAEILQSQLEKAGLKVEITQSTNTPADAVRLQPDMALAALDTNLLAPALDTTGVLNVCGWRNAEATQALADARDGSKTPKEQQAAWDKVQQILLDESPLVFTVVSPLLVAGSDKIQGITYVDSAFGPYLNTIYFTK